MPRWRPSPCGRYNATGWRANGFTWAMTDPDDRLTIAAAVTRVAVGASLRTDHGPAPQSA